MFAQQTMPAVKPLPKVEEAKTATDFKRLDLKFQQMGLMLTAATLIVTLYTLQKGRR